MILQVQQSPSTDMAFLDAAALNPSYKLEVGKSFVMVINQLGQKLLLPTAYDHSVPVGRVGLSNRQRRFLSLEMRDIVSIHVKYDEITIIPLLQRIDLVISCYFFGGEPRVSGDVVPRILNQFNERFSQHALNRGHCVPIKVSGMLFEVRIASLSDGDVEWDHGVMSGRCRIHFNFQNIEDVIFQRE